MSLASVNSPASARRILREAAQRLGLCILELAPGFNLAFLLAWPLSLSLGAIAFLRQLLALFGPVLAGDTFVLEGPTHARQSVTGALGLRLGLLAECPHLGKHAVAGLGELSTGRSASR